MTRAAFCPSRRDATPTPGRRSSPGEGPPARRRAEAHPKSNPSPGCCSNSNHSGRPSSRGVSVPRSSPAPKKPRASEGKSQAAPQSLPYEYGVLADKSTPAAALGRVDCPVARVVVWAAAVPCTPIQLARKSRQRERAAVTPVHPGPNWCRDKKNWRGTHATPAWPAGHGRMPPRATVPRVAGAGGRGRRRRGERARRARSTDDWGFAAVPARCRPLPEA